MMEPGEPLPISLVAHTPFCHRRTWLEASNEQADSPAITAGVIANERVDTKASGLTSRAVPVAHEEFGIVGRCDVVRADHEDAVTIVEYKATPGRRRTTVTPAMKTQLALQRLSLESAGHVVKAQQVYFIDHRRTVDVPLGDDDFARAKQHVVETRAIIESDQAPSPLVGDDRCGRCSHVGVCLPDERHLRSVGRRISVADPDGEILYLVTQGSRASLSADRLRVVKGDETLATLPFERVREVVVYGNVDLSSALVREMCWRRLTIVWCSSRGRVIGWTHSAESPNGLARSRQAALDPKTRMKIASEIIAAKIGGQATQLRRNARTDVGPAVTRLRTLSKRASTSPTPSELLGVEGDAGAVYFRHLPSVLGVRGSEFVERWPGRRGRASTDPLNAALNFCYGLLLGDVIRAIASCGLDPAHGVLHSSSRNKPALALDLMEQFRAPLADSVVLSAINNGELTVGMFDAVRGSNRLRDSGRRALVAGYGRRMATEVKHPVFGYSLTWSRVLEVQARLFLGVLDGSNGRYVAMRTR